MGEHREEWTDVMEQTTVLRDVRDELEELNGHIKAYLKCMSLTLLAGPCSGQEGDAAGRAVEAAALELLKHTQK